MVTCAGVEGGDERVHGKKVLDEVGIKKRRWRFAGGSEREERDLEPTGAKRKEVENVEKNENGSVAKRLTRSRSQMRPEAAQARAAGEKVVIDLIEERTDEKNEADSGKDVPPRVETVRVDSEERAHEVLFEFPPGLRGSIRVTRADFDRLAPEKYLNDSIIDFYIKYIEMFATPPALAKHCYFFNSFFFKRLCSTEEPQVVNHSNVRRWTQEVNLFTKKYVFVPICSSFHWTLVVICNCGSIGWDKRKSDPVDRPVMLIYDSLRKFSQTSWYSKALKAYLQEEFRAKKHEEFQKNGVAEYPDFGKMATLHPKVPQQKNDFDCGLYVLQYIVSFLEDSSKSLENLQAVNREYWFSETDIEILREHIRLVFSEQRNHLERQNGVRTEEDSANCG